MPVVMVHNIPGGTEEQYEAVAERLTGGRGLNSLDSWPVEGLLAHVSGPTDDGWRIIDVWESEDAYNTFMAERLGPAAERVTGPRIGAAQAQVLEVRHLLRG